MSLRTLLAALSIFCGVSFSIVSVGALSDGEIADAATVVAASPGDDFYQYVNGDWLARTQLPPDRGALNNFDIIAMQVEDQLTQILTADSEKFSGGREAEIQQEVFDYYRSFMDRPLIEARGLTPLAEKLRRIDALSTFSDVLAFSARPDNGASLGLTGYVTVDVKATDLYALYFYQSGPSFSSHYYGSEGEAASRALIVASFEDILSELSIPDAANRARDVFEFQAAISAVHWGPEEARDLEGTYNRYDRSELLRLADVPWNEFLVSYGAEDVDEIVLHHPSAIAAALELSKNTDLEVLKDHLRIGLIRKYGTVLPVRMELMTAGINRSLRGLDTPQDYSTLALSATTEAFREELGLMYANAYFDRSSRDAVEEMVSYVVLALERRMENSEWMSPETKRAAIQKLEKLEVKVGYPTVKNSNSPVGIEWGRAVENLSRIRVEARAQDMAKLQAPVDRSEWSLGAHEVSAYYRPDLNEIVFTAAILQPPFFDSSRDDATNYGAIGAVIAHEVIHGFDHQGRRFDAEGRLRDWWTEADEAEFEARAAQLGAQFSNYEVVPGTFVDPALTMGENIADLGGLSVALDALKLANPDADLREFFLSWARLWRGIESADFLIDRAEADPHSPLRYRTNGSVRNIDEWYSVFNVRPSDALYLEPNQRVRIW